MERVCFVFELNPGCEAAYDEAHRSVWPELLDLLDEAGVYDYSIFRDGTMLYAFFKVRDTWARSQSVIGRSDIQAQWEALMAPLIAWQKDVQGSLRTLPEVFRHEGQAGSAGGT